MGIDRFVSLFLEPKNKAKCCEMSGGLRQIATEPASLDGQSGPRMERSPRLGAKSNSERISDSEQSTETNSLSAESNNDGKSPVKSASNDNNQRPKGKQRRRGTDWEIIDSIKVLLSPDQVPSRLEGFLLKKRKWPLKGWHKVTVSET